MKTGSEAWHENHRAGMAAAASKTSAHRLSGETLATVRRTSREQHPCKIKGCKRTAYRGSLCKGHWDLVPLRDVQTMMVECMVAQRRTAAKFHRLFLRQVQESLAD